MGGELAFNGDGPPRSDFSNLPSREGIMSASGNSAGLKLYGARPYETDGGCSIPGLFVTTGVGVAVAVVMGVVAGSNGEIQSLMRMIAGPKSLITVEA
jgi:hypothetical protein